MGELVRPLLFAGPLQPTAPDLLLPGTRDRMDPGCDPAGAAVSLQVAGIELVVLVVLAAALLAVTIPLVLLALLEQLSAWTARQHGRRPPAGSSWSNDARAPPGRSRP